MTGDWTTSPSARRVQQHESDSRPAWLWSQDGQTLLWQNEASTLFLARLKKQGLKRAELAVPIKGQVARNIRLGSAGRTSLARIQFLAGTKPISSTCATTPLEWQDGQPALLIVGVDPIEAEVLDASRANRSVEPASAIEQVGEPAPALADTPAVQPGNDRQDADDHDLAALQIDALVEADLSTDVAETPASDSDAETSGSDAHAYAQELENWRSVEGDASTVFSVVEPALPDDHAGQSDEPAAELDPQPSVSSRLSLLVERLSSDEALFTPLTDADDALMGERAPADKAGQVSRRVVQDLVIITEIDETPVSEAAADLDAVAVLDGVAPTNDQVNEPTVAAVITELQPPAADPEAVERVSRYNFDELSRILNDRVGDTGTLPARSADPQRTGSLVSLGGETLVLNRLPLGILVFRDQQVLFANRAITEMVGYDTVESLRAAGLAAVFPAAGPEGQEAGPVNHLVQRDGTLVPVTARLQSISWQGRPALMLSASATEVRTGHETAVRAFAQTTAELRGDGFFEATRSGVFSAVTQKAATLLGASSPLEGKPLTAITASDEVAALQEFLERPARFAESERPYLRVRAGNSAAELLIFAQGQAGVVTNYFGFVRGREAAPARVSGPAEVDPALLARISRGVRRPLNTIIGFADLLRTQAFRGQEDKPFVGYAQDIATAGQDIAALVDELDNYSRLRDGRYLPQRTSIALTSLLESCVVRIREQANGARVIVRNAIAENLPKVTADRATLEQAVLNLLASAIDQSPTGGAVVISAQVEDDGGIAIHVRDSSSNAVDMAERFVVFRDGVGRNGQMLAPVRSSVGLALTRSLLAVNTFSLSVDPAGERGLLFTLLVPADLVEKPPASDVAE